MFGESCWACLLTAVWLAALMLCEASDVPAGHPVGYLSLAISSHAISSLFLSHPPSLCLSAFSVCLTVLAPRPRPHPFTLPSLSLCVPLLSLRPSFVFLSPSHCPVAGWLVVIIPPSPHPPPPVKRIMLAINARLDKAGTSRVRGEGRTSPDSFVIG